MILTRFTQRAAEAPTEHTPRLWLRWVGAVGLLAIAVFARGYRVYAGHQGLQLPLVEHVADPTLFPHDPFVATLGRYATPLWWAVGVASRVVPLEPMLFALFLLEKICLLLSGAALARALRPHSAAAPWAGAAVLALGISPLLGGGTVVKTYFEQTAASIPFFLWAFAALIERRPWRWALASAMGCTLNAMYGVYALTFSACGLLVTYRGRSLREWIAPALAFAGLSAPTFGWAWRVHGTAAPEVATWLAAAHARSLHHLFPLSDGFLQPAAFALLMATALVTAAGVTARADRPGASFLRAAAVCSGAWLLFALVAAYLVPVPKLLMLQPARATDLWYALVGVFLAAHWAAQAEAGPRGVGLLGTVAALMLQRFPPGSVLVGSVWLLALRPGVGACLRGRRLAQVAVAAVILLFGALGAKAVLARFAGYRSAFQEEAGASASVREAGAWARAHAPTRAVFLVPPEMGMFRAFSRRSVVSSWQEGGAILWDPPFAAEWVRRMHALGEVIAPEKTAQWPVAASPYPTGWTDAQLASTGRAFEVEYCVLPSGHRTRLPVAFAGREGFKIVRVRW